MAGEPAIDGHPHAATILYLGWKCQSRCIRLAEVTGTAFDCHVAELLAAVLETVSDKRWSRGVGPARYYVAEATISRRTGRGDVAEQLPGVNGASTV